jgi:MarR family transcriptional regulator, organic hydroperoxide resistance regulator
MERASFLGYQYRLWMLLSQTRGAISKARDKRAGCYIPPNQAAALVAIWAFKGQATPTLLSHYLFQEHHSVSGLITRMEKNGFVVKNRDKKLKTVVRVAITPKGQEVISKAMDVDFISSMMDTLSEKQQKQLESCLQKLLKKACAELGVKTLMPFPHEQLSPSCPGIR